MIEKMNLHYSFTNPASVHDEEALTALELAGRQGAKINEVIEDQNNLRMETANHLAMQDDRISVMNNETMPAKVKAEVSQRVQSGEFDREINAYIGNLETRVDNLLNDVPEGSTTMDAEIIDARVDMNGKTFPNLGSAIRAQDYKHTETAKANDVFVRKNLIRKVNKGKFLNGSGIQTDINCAYTDPIFLRAGETVYATNGKSPYGTNRHFAKWDNALASFKMVNHESIYETYCAYPITEDGYYSFNVNPNKPCVTYEQTWLENLGIGVYVESKILNLEELASGLDRFTRRNLVKNTLPGFLNTGSLNNISGYCHSQPIFLRAGDTVYAPVVRVFGVNTYLWMVTSDGEPLYTKAEPVETNETYHKYIIDIEGYYSVNGEGEYACCTFDPAFINSPMGCYMPSDLLNVDEPVFAGKKITFNGDSICAGAGSAGGYAKIIGDMYGATVENIAVGGGVITHGLVGDSGSARHCISATIESMSLDSDYAIVEGGVNDAAINVPLGAISSGYTGTLDTSTFIGACELMCKSLVTRFAGKKVGFIIVHKMTERFSSLTPNCHYYALKAVLEKWGVPYLDLNNECPPLGYVDTLKTRYTLNGDGWHPNEEGYKKYYVPKIVAWMKTL